MEELDINAEYERIFGVNNYPTLFKSVDEEYKKIRHEIITSPLQLQSFSKLPFEDINISIEEDINISIEETESIPNSSTTCYDIVVSMRNHIYKTITDVLNALGGSRTKQSMVIPPMEAHHHKHIFWLIQNRRCKAYGFFDKETRNFYICAGSLISIYDDSEYIMTSSYRNRHRLIDKYGIQEGVFIRIKKDVKCRSAVAAARYASGAMVNAELWVDSSGMTLYDVYPEFFFN